MNFINKLDEYSINKREKILLPHLKTKSKYILSVQASENHYCSPRANLEDINNYEKFELMIFTKEKEFLKVKFDGFTRQDELDSYYHWGIYACVPKDLIEDLYNFLNGIDKKEKDNSNKTIILINGKAGSGKTTLATTLMNQINKSDSKDKAYVIHNADTVKEIATNSFGWNNIKDDDGRKLLIGLSEVGYTYNKNFWEKKTLEKIEERFNSFNENIFIIPDFRYKQTYDFFKEQNFNVITIYVSMDKDNNTLNQEMKTHNTEEKIKIKFDEKFKNKYIEDVPKGVNIINQFCVSFRQKYKIAFSLYEEIEVYKDILQELYDKNKFSQEISLSIFNTLTLSNKENLNKYIYFDKYREKFMIKIGTPNTMYKNSIYY